MLQLEKELENQFSLLSQQPTEQVFELNLPGQLTYFQGHFPGFPVLPAVAFIDISAFLIQKITDRTPESFKKITHIKLKKPLAPSTKVQVQIFHKSENQIEVIWQDYANLSIEY